MSTVSQRLRVALVAGTLGQGGAEKQLLYIARELYRANVDLRIYSLTRGEFYESAFTELGLRPIWIGSYQNPLLRLRALSSAVRQFEPHILQSMHFFTNLYTAIVARQIGAIGIGGIRNDTSFELGANAFWGKRLLRTPKSLIANSYCAKKRAEALGIKAETVYVLPNVLDLTDFDRKAAQANGKSNGTRSTIVMCVGRLVREKRWERFVTAFSTSRRKVGRLRGIMVGDGPERGKLESMARSHNLHSDSLRFLGSREDVPALLKSADMLVLCSDNEGFPNVLLEGMAAGLPVITTPAGDSGRVVQDGVTGYVVPFDDHQRLADCIVELAGSPTLRRQLGAAGRKRVEDEYGFADLAPRLLSIYRDIAVHQNRQQVLTLLS